MSIRHRIRWHASFLVLPLLVVSCTSEGSGGTPSEERTTVAQSTTTDQAETAVAPPTEETTLEDVRLQVVTGGAASLIWPVAPPFLEEQAVPYEYVDIGGSDNAVMLMIGETEIGLLGPLEVAELRNQGADVTIVAPLFNQFNAIFARADDQRSLEDLQGTRIGDYGPGSTTVPAYQVIMGMQGIDYNSYFEQVSAAPPVLRSLLDEGDVDIAAIGPTLNLPMLGRPDEYRIVYGPLSHEWQALTGKPLLLAGLAARESFVEENPDIVHKVVRALRATIEQINGDPGQVIDEHGDLFAIETPGERDATIELLDNGPLYSMDLSDDFIASELRFLEEALALGVIEEIPDGIFYCLENADSPVCSVD